MQHRSTPSRCECAPHLATVGVSPEAVHGCVRAASSPHLVAIRMCASVTAARQHKRLPQMEGWKEGTEKMVQNRRKMAASHRQTANQTRHKAGRNDECRKDGGGANKGRTNCNSERGVLNVCRSFPVRRVVVWCPTSRGG